MRLAGALAALVLLAGCTLYPSFTGEVTNDTGRALELRVTVHRGDEQVFQESHELASGERWNLGVFSRTNGDHRIVVEADGVVVAEDTHRFDHDEGPGGFTVRFSNGTAAEISYWHN